MTDYRALRSFTKFGTGLAVAAGLFIPAVAFGLMQMWEWNWPLFGLSVIVGGFAGFLVKVLAELAQVIVDMLLPRTD
jgi:hypothetical protein